MEETRENLINAISSLSNHFFRYLEVRSDIDESEKNDTISHIVRMIIVSLVSCANHKIIFDLEAIDNKLFKCIDNLNSYDGKKELQKMWVDTHGRLVSYRDLRGG